MNLRTLALAICTLALLCSAARAQRARPAKVTALQATTDKSGSHPATGQTTGPAKVMCINGVSETPGVVVSCYLVAPGFKGVVKAGQSIDATGAGTVTLTCHGQGFMRCNARIN